MLITQDRLEVSGCIFSGLGEGKKYVLMPEYNLILSELLNGRTPYPGTLNVELLDGSYEDIMRFCRPKIIKTKEINGRLFGGFYYWFADLIIEKSRSIINDVLVIRPLLTKHNNRVIEIVSDIHIRAKFNLCDGDLVRIIIKKLW